MRLLDSPRIAGRRDWLVAAIFAGLTLLLASLALLAPLNHDESQYFAAAELSTRLMPFRDFLYLQTPLQPLLLAPLAGLSASYSFVTLRLVQALIGAGILLLVYLGQRTLGVGRKVALGAALLLLFSHAFQFSVTVVRNDALPALLMAAGLYLGLRAMRHPAGRADLCWFGAGLAFAGAAAAKISFALPAAAVGLYLAGCVLFGRSRQDLRNALACGAGAAFAALPVLALWHAAPFSFDYGVFDYSLRAPFDWYGGNGLGHRLIAEGKASDFLGVLLRGTPFAALAAVLLSMLGPKARERRGNRPILFLDMLVLAGAVAAFLPTPVWQQYMMPLLPPLYVRLGILIADLGREKGWRRPALLAALVVGMAIGASQPVKWALRGEPDPIDATEEAHWIGDQLRKAGAQGEIATLSPQVTLDSGYPLDPRFAAGPFFYRTGDVMREDRQRLIHAISPATLEEFLSERPPAAIVTGYETRHRVFTRDLDRDLRAYAARHGYRHISSPYGDAELYIAPARARVSGAPPATPPLRTAASS
ncbi:MAG TPA: phospholipid carrier-dependent glycosyltransferase [Allosphingosinicella sp.]